MSTSNELKTRLQQPLIVFVILLFSGLPIFLNSFFENNNKADDFANYLFNKSILPNSQPAKEMRFPQLAGEKTDSLKEVSKSMVAISH